MYDVLPTLTIGWSERERLQTDTVMWAILKSRLSRSQMDSLEELKSEESQKSDFPKILDLISGPSNGTGTQSTPSAMRNFTWERFRNSPDICRKRVTAYINAHLREVDATVGLLRYATPELHRLERELGLLNIKCRTFYEHFAYNRCLRQHANYILDSFDLSAEKNIEEIVLSAPPLLRDSLRLYQTRWRKAVFSTKWHNDLVAAKEELDAVQKRLERCKQEYERKKMHLEMYKKIQDAKEEFVDLSEEDKLKKVESLLGMKAPPCRSKESTPASRSESIIVTFTTTVDKFVICAIKNPN
ncbi:unnamed protein product [Strongylus vulgaris]|uniref:Uncharacterized protein n=1 Tax=Strongylus vulgaris TaxID=40348 RepID=A0A3P7LLK8_STRVU|nr:unnamed protein product [Strongylus vulgaris]